MHLVFETMSTFLHDGEIFRPTSLVTRRTFLKKLSRFWISHLKTLSRLAVGADSFHRDPVAGTKDFIAESSSEAGLFKIVL